VTVAGGAERFVSIARSPYGTSKMPVEEAPRPFNA
jgi:hypothetical protein